MKKLIAVSALLLILVSVLPVKNVRADVAPPESPPGTNLLPGNESTQVRMMAETVTLTISKDPSYSGEAIAKTEAIFTMRNLGTKEEKMQVRFPLSFFNGNSDGMGNFPEIPSLAVKINGKAVTTKRENQPFFNSEYSYKEREEIPWAVFDVSFPPSQDVTIEVAYLVEGFGYYPYEMFKYILETGAGWNETIGSVDIIAHLPYEANQKSVFIAESAGYGETTSGGVLSGNEISWHFDELEPTWENNIQVMVVTPSLWESVLKESTAVEKNPNDGEAWGRLAKSYKEIVRMPKGYLREDPPAHEMFKLSKNAYEKCLALLPKDPLWHYGYADLLWSHYYYDIYMAGNEDIDGILPTILKELQTVLTLDPNNQQAKDILTEISYQIPAAVSLDADNFVLLGLTATPIPPTPNLVPSETPAPTLTEIVPTQGVISTPTESPQPATSNPFCGSAFLFPVLLSVVFLLKKNETL